MEIEIPHAGLPEASSPVAVLGVVAAILAIGLCVWAVTVLAGRIARGEPVVLPRPSPLVAWQGIDVAWIAVLVVCLQAAAGAVAGPRPAPIGRQLVAGMLAMAAAVVVGSLHLLRRGASWRSLGFAPAPGGEDLRLALAALALVLAPLLGLAGLLDRIVPYRHPIIDFLSAHRDWRSVAIVAVSAVVVAPVAEEFLFRRVLQGWLEKAAGGAAAIAVSSLAFGLAHLGHGLAWLPLVLFGAVLGFLARQTGSILPGIIVHGLFNAVSVAIVLLQGG